MIDGLLKFKKILLTNVIFFKFINLLIVKDYKCFDFSIGSTFLMVKFKIIYDYYIQSIKFVKSKYSDFCINFCFFLL